MDEKIKYNFIKKINPFFFILLFVTTIWLSPSIVNSKKCLTLYDLEIPNYRELNIVKNELNKGTMKDLNDTMFYYNERYAVIVVGLYKDKLHYQWFTNAAQQQYTVLTETYGLNSSKIYVLLTLREEWADVLKINPAIIDYNSTEENISMVFNYLKTILDDDDLLYIAVISHGGDTHHLFFENIKIDFDLWQGIVAHDTYFGLEDITNDSINIFKLKNILDMNGNHSTIDNCVFDYELNEYTKEVNARRIIFVLQPCFSGGFVNDLSKENHIIFTASTEAQLATASFIEYFADGLNGSAPDSNYDGRISLGEVYEYTAGLVYQWIHDNPDEYKGRREYPLIDDNGDKIGHRYHGWFGYNQNKANKDGYTAARIYNLSYEEI